MALFSMMRNCPESSQQTEIEADGAGGEQIGEVVVKMRPGEKQNYNSRRKIKPAGVYSLLLVSVVMALTMSSVIQPLYANPTCILNCAQCVKIYGDFFDGHSCAKVCVDSRSRYEALVDCADPTTIARFLKTY